MKYVVFAVLAAASAGMSAGVLGVKPSLAHDRVKTPLRIDFRRIGTLAPRTAAEIGDSEWGIG